MKRSFSMVELAVAVLVLSVALMAMVATLYRGSDVRRSADDGELAAQRIRAELETYRAMNMADVVPSIRDAAPAGVMRATTDIDELEDGVLTAEVLDEPACVGVFGLGQVPDLDGNGDPDSSEHTRYGVVPVRITLSWTTSSGARSRQISSVFYPRSTGS